MTHAVRLHEISESQLARVEAQEFYSKLKDLEQAQWYCRLIKAETERESPNPERMQEWFSALEETLGDVQTFIYGHWHALTEDMAL